MTSPTVLTERDGSIATLWLNRPERANTFNDELMGALWDEMRRLANDREIRAIVVTGSGRHFSGGNDLRAVRSGPKHTSHHPLDFDWVPQPLVAAINGAAMGGGCELALACDFRFMATTAQIGLPEIRFGAVPALGGTARLPRLIGVAAAKRMIMTGEPLDATEAERIGLVDQVVDPEDVLSAAQVFARSLAVHAPYAMRTAKQLLNRSLEVSLGDALELERALIANMATPEEIAAARRDAAERMATYANIFSQPDDA